MTAFDYFIMVLAAISVALWVGVIAVLWHWRYTFLRIIKEIADIGKEPRK